MKKLLLTLLLLLFALPVYAQQTISGAIIRPNTTPPTAFVSNSTTPQAGYFYEGNGEWAVPQSSGLTSIGISLPLYTFSNSPLTANGTLNGSLNSQSQNEVLISPNGSSGIPSFRSLVYNDFPLSGASSGSYTYPIIVVNNQGIITSISNGTPPINYSFTLPLLNTSNIISINRATDSLPGSMSASDKTKLDSYPSTPVAAITALTGDGSATGPGSSMFTLATVNNGPGSFTNASITVNGKGQVTAASSGTGVGSVTSVGLTAPSIFMVSGTPVTSSGILGLTLNSQSVNLVFAGPSSGSAAAPTFRSLVYADFPTSGATATSYGSATSIPTFTVNAQGILTATSSATVNPGQVNSVPYSSTAPTQNQIERWNGTDSQMEPSTLAELQPVLAVATSNISSLSGYQTIDGVTFSGSSRVLLTAQTTASQNGLWTVNVGAWTRPITYSSGQSITPSAFVASTGGTVYANTFWQLTGTTTAVTVDTTATTWKQLFPVATTGVAGLVKPDGSTITISGGTISAATQTATGTAGGSLTGSYPNPTIAASGVSSATYTNSTVTVGTDGRITSASSGTAPVTTITAGTGVTVTGTTTPTISIGQSVATTATPTFAGQTLTTTDTSSSGISNISNYDPIYNQSGTAGFNTLTIAPTSTGLGSGAKNLISATMGGSPVLNVGATGSSVLQVLNWLKVYATTSAEASFSDITGSANGSSPLSYFPTGAVNDRIYFGYDQAPFTGIYFSKSTGALSTTTLSWQYWNGSAWTTLSVTDGSSGLTASGEISWSAILSPTIVNGVYGYFVRATVATANYTTNPTGNIILSMTPGLQGGLMITGPNNGGQGAITLPAMLTVLAPRGFNGYYMQGYSGGNVSYTIGNSAANFGSRLVGSGTPAASSASSSVRFGSLEIVGGNTNGTILGMNTASGVTYDLADLQLNGTKRFVVDYLGDTTIGGHIISGGSTPTAAAGTYVTGAPTVSGNDTAGNITATGTSIGGVGTLVIVSFGTAYASSPHAVIITPSSSAAASAICYVTSVGTGGFTISSTLTAGTSASLSWNYQVMQ